MKNNFQFINLLNIQPSDSLSTIKQKYFKLLRKYETVLRRTDDKILYETTKASMIELINMFTEYFCEENGILNIETDAYAIVVKNEKFICRCGATFDTTLTGIKECDFCSCFIYVKNELIKIS